MQRILLLDNFDSFTYNLVHYLSGLEVEVDVIRNDAQIPDLSVYDGVVLSPGPGLPHNAGNLMKMIEIVDGRIPILGVCLGMQAIAMHLGGEIYNQTSVKHGVQESIVLENSALFEGLPASIDVGLYHSWAVKKHNNYTVTAQSRSSVVMAIENRECKLYGVQFHPESVMTPDGGVVLKNFLKLA